MDANKPKFQKQERAKKPINVAVGARLRDRRELLRLSREELAEKADVTPKFISGLEYGTGGMSITTLDKVAKALDVSCDYLIRGDDMIQLNYDLQALLKEVKMEDRRAVIELLESDLYTYKQLILKSKA